MNLFVIMPFAPDFEDVYVAIKSSVREALAGEALRCFRLDETRAAGRITPRLIEELGAASLCVADLTGLRPNVMWEVGYAMALGKPTIIITQDKHDLPFDIRDMQAICYDRGHLSQSLARPLTRSVIDTVTAVRRAKPAAPQAASERDSLVGGLLEEVRGLKEMLSQAVKTWGPAVVAPVAAPAATPDVAPAPPQAAVDLKHLEGAWYNEESNSHVYARLIGGELVAPYCFRGDSHLTAVYYGWRRIGEYWFARYRWLVSPLSGFTFLKQPSVDVLTGAWWSMRDAEEQPELPEMGSGVPSRWTRRREAVVPKWAEDFFEDVRREGLATRLSRAVRDC
jgi:hypothetical protein